jgi:hypothetical protein
MSESDNTMPESLTSESGFNSGCLLFDKTDSESNKCHTAKYFRFAADEDHHEAQFRHGRMLQNGDGSPLNEGFAGYYFALASSIGYLDRNSFMISPNREVLFRNTTTLIDISSRMINFLRFGCFLNAQFERVRISADSQLRRIEMAVVSDCNSLTSICCSIHSSGFGSQMFCKLHFA